MCVMSYLGPRLVGRPHVHARRPRRAGGAVPHALRHEPCPRRAARRCRDPPRRPRGARAARGRRGRRRRIRRGGLRGVWLSERRGATPRRRRQLARQVGRRAARALRRRPRMGAARVVSRRRRRPRRRRRGARPRRRPRVRRGRRGAAPSRRSAPARGCDSAPLPRPRLPRVRICLLLLLLVCAFALPPLECVYVCVCAACRALEGVRCLLTRVSSFSPRVHFHFPLSHVSLRGTPN